jgi:fructose-1,6-bisphosphatase/inositol monophosphatase family enzyme
MVADGPIQVDQLLRHSVYLVRNVQKGIATRLEFDPEIALQRIPDPKKDPNNQPLRIDYYAEDVVVRGLQQKFKSRICAVGEESLERRPDLKDITKRTDVVAIMDIIDGTDLLLRRFANWCSAIVFFYPPRQEILLSLVADHEGNVFYATKDKPTPFFYSSKSRSLDDAVPLSSVTRLNQQCAQQHQSSICRFANTHLAEFVPFL